MNRRQRPAPVPIRAERRRDRLNRFVRLVRDLLRSHRRTST